jgi:AraC family transcriptional regulator
MKQPSSLWSAASAAYWEMQLAQLAGVSARHLERAFRQSVGVPVHAYVLRRRISLAQELLLKQPALSIDEISTKTGFSSSTHLATVFKRQVGCSPTAFRRLHAPWR